MTQNRLIDKPLNPWIEVLQVSDDENYSKRVPVHALDQGRYEFQLACIYTH